MTQRAAPGWYQAEGDPAGTIRYWNGDEWVGEARPAGPIRALVHGRVIADPKRRIGAALIDGFILTLFAVPALINVFRDVDFEAIAAGTADVPTVTIPPGWALAMAAFALLYYVVTVALWGATPGKLIMRIEIILQKDGTTPPGWKTALMRYSPSWIIAIASQLAGLANPTLGSAVSNLGLLVSLASLVLIFSDSTRRSVYDMVAKTNVVQK